jgi:hypothetical protein
MYVKMSVEHCSNASDRENRNTQKKSLSSTLSSGKSSMVGTPVSAVTGRQLTLSHAKAIETKINVKYIYKIVRTSQ